MREPESESVKDLSDLLNRLNSGEKITEDETMFLIREGYFPTASEGIEIILKDISPDKIKTLPEEYLKILRRFLLELLEEEGKIDAIMAIEGSAIESNGMKLRKILKKVEDNIK